VGSWRPIWSRDATFLLVFLEIPAERAAHKVPCRPTKKRVRLWVRSQSRVRNGTLVSNRSLMKQSAKQVGKDAGTGCLPSQRLGGAEPQALPHPEGRCSRPRNVLRDSAARCHAKAERFGRGERMVTCAANVGAHKLVAEASGHPIQRHQSHLKGEGRLALHVVACGTHQGLYEATTSSGAGSRRAERRCDRRRSPHASPDKYRTGWRTTLARAPWTRIRLRRFHERRMAFVAPEVGGQILRRHAHPRDRIALRQRRLLRPTKSCQGASNCRTEERP